MIRSADITNLKDLPPQRATVAHRPFAKRGAYGGRQRHRPGQMNGLERKYAEHLESLYRSGAVTWFAFEAVTFKLAGDTRYTPDFVVMLDSGIVEFHEVKGTTKDKKSGKRKAFIEPAAKIKIKVAAEILPFRFSLFFHVKDSGWHRKDYWEEACGSNGHDFHSCGMDQAANVIREAK